MTNAVVVVVASSTSDAAVSFRRVFDAVDANGDHSITEEEFAAAVDRLVGFVGVGGGGGGGGVGGGDPPPVVVADSGGSSLEAPPLGMDANPSMFRPKADGGGGKKKRGGGKLYDPASTTAFVKGLISSFSAIMATEIGDKTFFIAAVLSMRNDRAAVFGGAILALVVMTVLSTLMGLVLPALMPRRYTHLIGGALFLYFGFKLLSDSRSMGEGVSEELEEVEEELAEMNKKRNRAKKKRQVEEKKGMDDDDDDVGGGGGSDADDDVEGGGGTMGDCDNGAKKRRGGGGGGGGRFAKGASRQSSSGGLSTAGEYSGNSWESVFVQALTLTFLAEWGDRSQIATIALAAAKDPVGVTIGGCIGHSVCTGMAVMGGRMLASRISEKSVAFYGGLTFLIFGIHSVFFEE
ncbi:hypothetical protein ACHAW5_001275 [Stephanodiscus triporus]|uniref:EF-hand domain-containing protein n=1 Tax=Stephanodiscus triporus TaxID=2934178 RepID=A0ABD3QFT1_9STRA